MTVEILRAQAEPRIEPGLEVPLLFSLLGLTITLALLPLLSGSDYGTWLAMAG
jgi:hypothetical protein